MNILGEIERASRQPRIYTVAWHDQATNETGREDRAPGELLTFNEARDRADQLNANTMQVPGKRRHHFLWAAS